MNLRPIRIGLQTLKRHCVDTIDRFKVYETVGNRILRHLFEWFCAFSREIRRLMGSDWKKIFKFPGNDNLSTLSTTISTVQHSDRFLLYLPHRVQNRLHIHEWKAYQDTLVAVVRPNRLLFALDAQFINWCCEILKSNNLRGLDNGRTSISCEWRWLARPVKCIAHSWMNGIMSTEATQTINGQDAPSGRKCHGEIIDQTRQHSWPSVDSLASR